MCNDNQPWAVDDNLSYGFAAASISGKSESDFCCSCYELTFSSGEIEGKKMVVQVTNTGGDLSNNHFDLQIPGGGVGIFNGCQTQVRPRSNKNMARPFLTILLLSGMHPAMAGASATAVSAAHLNALSFPSNFRMDASGASTGSRTLTTPTFPSSKYLAPLSSSRRLAANAPPKFLHIPCS